VLKPRYTELREPVLGIAALAYKPAPYPIPTLAPEAPPVFLKFFKARYPIATL